MTDNYRESNDSDEKRRRTVRGEYLRDKDGITSDTDYDGCRFYDLRPTALHVRGSTFTGVTFEGGDFEGTTFSECHFERCVFVSPYHLPHLINCTLILCVVPEY